MWHNPDGHGHIAVVVPALAPGLHIAQAGASCFEHGPLAQGFGARAVRVFMHD